MKYVYMLTHARDIGDGEKAAKLLGFYATKKDIDNAIKRYVLLAGFKDYPDDFEIEKMEIDFDDFDFEEA